MSTLTDSSLGVSLRIELDYTSTARTAIGLILDLSTLDGANRGEKLNKIIVAGRPGKVTDVDQVARIAARCRKVGERVGRVGRSVSIIAGATWTTTTSSSKTSSIATTATEASAVAATTSKSAASTKATSKTATASKAAAEAAGTTSSEAVLTHFKVTALPLVAVELGDGVARIFGGVKGNNTRSLGATIWSHVDIGADNGAGDCSLTEEVLEILPADVVGKLDILLALQGTRVV